VQRELARVVTLVRMMGGAPPPIIQSKCVPFKRGVSMMPVHERRRSVLRNEVAW